MRAAGLGDQRHEDGDEDDDEEADDDDEEQQEQHRSHARTQRWIQALDVGDGLDQGLLPPFERCLETSHLCRRDAVPRSDLPPPLDCARHLA